MKHYSRLYWKRHITVEDSEVKVFNNSSVQLTKNINNNNNNN